MRLAHRILGAALAAVLWTAAAQDMQPHDLTLMEGKGHLLQFQRDITRVVVAEPKIADAVVVSPREVMVNAKGAGSTTVIVWEGDNAPLKFEVSVFKDNSEWDAFTKKIQESAEGGAVTATGTGDTIVLTGKVSSAEISKRLAGLAQTRAKSVINLLQSPPAAEPRQVLLQVKFAALNRVALKQIGFNLFSTNNKLQGTLTTEQFNAPRFSAIQGGAAPSVNFSDLLNLFAFRPDLNIGATIKALQENNLLQILAEPNLIALDGKEASFLAGGSFPYPTITTTPTGGATAPVITVQFKPFGVKLNFTPTITALGAIDLKVAPEVSSLDYTNAVTLEGFTIPALAQRSAETEVVLKDGESFAIAGLIDNSVIETIDKIPGLGNIPILGKLFQSRTKQKSDDELLVVITPHLVRPLTPDQQMKMLDFPETFLPAAPEKKGKGKKDDKPEFVGPRGQQIPKDK